MRTRRLMQKKWRRNIVSLGQFNVLEMVDSLALKNRDALWAEIKGYI
jgi:hypothetical protein